jgi:hypothetical protein
LQIRDIDLDQGLIHIAFNYVVKGGKKIRKDTKTHQDRWLAIDPDTCALIASYLDEVRTALAAVGVQLAADAYLFSNEPGHTRPWNPDWATHRISAAADAVRVDLDIKGGRHYTASQLLAAGFDRRNTAARLGHSGGGATTLRHYADPVPEADRRAATYLSRLTSNAAAAAETRRQQQLVPPGGHRPYRLNSRLYRAQPDLLPSCVILRSSRRRCARPCPLHARRACGLGGRPAAAPGTCLRPRTPGTSN